MVEVFDHDRTIHENLAASLIQSHYFSLHIDDISWVLVYNVPVNQEKVQPEAHYMRLVLLGLAFFIIILVFILILL